MMDPAKTTLGRMLLDQITPAIMVLRTPLVEESCRRNGLSFIEMLNPFCNFNNIDVPVRTASDQPYRLRRFKLRLFYASEIRQPNIEDHRNTVDFILITESQSDCDPEVSRSKEIFTYHSHSRIARTSPISWLMNGPQIVRHDFSAAFCEINLKFTVHNSSEDNVSVRFTTHNSIPPINTVSNSASVSGNELGWYDLSRSNDIKGTSDVTGTRAGKTLFPESVSPFIWSRLTSTHFNLDPFSSTEVPLHICVFSPGTYDLSNYSLHWTLLPAGGKGDDEKKSRVSSGTCQGHSYHITVLQKD